MKRDNKTPPHLVFSLIILKFKGRAQSRAETNTYSTQSKILVLSSLLFVLLVPRQNNTRLAEVLKDHNKI